MAVYYPPIEQRAQSVSPEDRKLPPLPPMPRATHDSLYPTPFLHHEKSRFYGSPASPASSWSGASVRADSFSPQLPPAYLPARKADRYYPPAPTATKRKAEHIDEPIVAPISKAPRHQWNRSLSVQPTDNRPVYLPASGLPSSRPAPRAKRDNSSSQTLSKILALAQDHQDIVSKLLAKLDNNDSTSSPGPEL